MILLFEEPGLDMKYADEWLSQLRNARFGTRLFVNGGGEIGPIDDLACGSIEFKESIRT